MDEWKLWALALALTGGGLAAFFSAFPRLRLWRTISNTPTAKARSAPMGPVELSGIAAEGEGVVALQGPLSALACLWWRFTVEEEQTRVNAKGETHYEWVSLADERSNAPFYLKDLTGLLRIDPSGAEVDTPARLSKVSGGLFGSAPPPGPSVALYPGSWGRRKRYTEWRIEPQRPLYALGVLRPEAAGPTLERGRSGEVFYLATMSEDEARRSVMLGLLGRLSLGLVLFGAGLYLCIALAMGVQF